MHIMKKIVFVTLLFCLAVPLSAQLTKQDSVYRFGPQKEWSPEQVDAWWQWYNNRFQKTAADNPILRQDVIMNGNKITTQIWNYGSISAPGNRTTDIIWEGLGYGYEFGPFVASEIPVPPGSHPDVIRKNDSTWVVHAISDGLISNGGEVSPDFTERWGWEPLEVSDDGVNVYLNSTQNTMPTNDAPDQDADGKPDTWPDAWYNENLRDYVWPGALGQGATNADKEALFVMDDVNNREFEYYPYPGDSVRKGLGLEVEGRVYQWSNPLAEDAIFLIYKIRNKGAYDLNRVIFGMWGDPHIGGPDNWQDDLADFNRDLNMTFAWDNDGRSDIAGRVPGYMGYKFLESPGLSNDGIDNDKDGLVDESWTNGIDDDNDWTAETDDVGIDGVPNTLDEGEGDGVPTAGDPFDITKPGEPNFEFTDIDESDMIGLTSFAQPSFSGLQISDDEEMWSRYIQPGQFDTLAGSRDPGDYVFLYGSGRFTLRSIQTTPDDQISEAIKRFSIALIIGEDRNDLIQNAETVQRIYDSGYQFAKPPAKPNLTAVPGDRKVTLYWDKVAESSFDAVSGENDFEGYVIYRSTDPGFLDIQNITDINGTKFLFEPLKTVTGVDARFDLDNEYSGPSNVPYTGRGVAYNLGNNTGLRYTFIDSNNVINGQQYFYAVVSYDHGSDSLGIPPSECAKIVTFDPTTNTYSTDVNTALVTPRSRTAGYVAPRLTDGIQNETGGRSTGTIFVSILDESAVEDNNTFEIQFADSTAEGLEYTVEDQKTIEETFISFYGRSVSLQKQFINPESFIVRSEAGETFTEGVDYGLEARFGTVTVFDPDSVPGAGMMDDTRYIAEYTHFPIFRSFAVDSQQTNPIFDGMQLVIKNEEFRVNEDLTGWNSSAQTDMQFTLLERDSASFYPADYELRFFSDMQDSSINDVATNFQLWNVTENTKSKFFVLEKAATRNGLWDPGEDIFIFENGTNTRNAVWQLVSQTRDTSDAPANGDIFLLATFKPFNPGDIFRFTTEGAREDKALARNKLDDIRVVPNPYVATNVIEPANPTARDERGFRRIYFDKVPQKCTIRIYTTAGELVRTLHHDSSVDDGKVYWDLLTRDNIEVAYGLYFYHVDAPGIGTTVGKFAIIK